MKRDLVGDLDCSAIESSGIVRPSNTAGGSLMRRSVMPMTSCGSFEAHFGAYSGASIRYSLMGSGGRAKKFRVSVSSQSKVTMARPIKIQVCSGAVPAPFEGTAETEPFGEGAGTAPLHTIAMASNRTPFHRQENWTNGIPGMRCQSGALINGI